MRRTDRRKNRGTDPHNRSLYNKRAGTVAYLEAGRAPVDKLNRAFSLDGGNCGVDVFRHHIPAVEKTTGHVLSMARVALNLLGVKKRKE